MGEPSGASPVIWLVLAAYLAAIAVGCVVLASRPSPEFEDVRRRDRALRALEQIASRRQPQ